MPCLALDPSGDLAFPLRLSRGEDVVAVRVSVRLRTAIGDWITDVAFGLPWREWIVDTGPLPLEVSALTRAQLEVTPGVLEVVSCRATRAGQAVSVVVVCRVREDGEDGVLEIGTSFDPFATSGAPAWYVVRATPRGTLV